MVWTDTTQEPVTYCMNYTGNSNVYIVDADTDSPYVWAADKKGKLEKRSVILGQLDEELGEYEIADGLSKDDCIAYPSDILEEGMSTTTNIEDAMDTNNIGNQSF